MPRMNPLGSLFDIVEGFPPVDLQTGTAGLRTGDWVDLKNAAGVLVVFGSGLGTNGDDPTLTFLQATSNAGAGSKALSPSTSPLHTYKKQAATNLAAVTVWATAAADFTANAWLNTDAAEQSVLLAVWIDASELDVNNGFHFLNAGSSDVGGNAQPGYLIYIVMTEYPNDPTKMVSALG